MTKSCSKYLTLTLCLVLFIIGCSSNAQKKERFLSEGEKYFHNKEYKEAIIQLKNAIHMDPESSKAYWLLSKSYLKTSNINEAFKTLLAIEQMEPDSIEVKLELASAYFANNIMNEAQSRIDEVLKKDPQNIRGLYTRADILSAQGESLDKIRLIYREILKIDPAQTKARQILSKIYTAKKQFDKAEQICSRKLLNSNLKILIVINLCSASTCI